MDFQTRLRRLSASGASPTGAQPSLLPPPSGASFDGGPPSLERQDTLSELRALIARAEARGPSTPRPPPTPALPLPGVVKETGFGPVRVVDHYLAPEHRHGRAPVAGALKAQSEIVAMLALDPSLGAIDWRRALYFDTETTGLSGGTGTLPFLVGCAWFEDESFRMEQLFLESPAEELALLEHLRTRIEGASCLVSYNGKAFDWPLLFGRYVMARAAPPPLRPHLDLLHVARRCFRRRLGSVRLVEIEQSVLGMHRERDIDGSEIPGLYWSFLRHRDGTAMHQVLEHNANDLVALAALLGFVAERGTEPAVHDDPVDHLALAEVAFKAKDRARAARYARAAFEGGGEAATTVRAGLLLADLFHRAKDFGEARRVLDDALEAAGRDAALACSVHLALAKLWEHRLKEPRRAEVHARATAGAESLADQARRAARLARKLAKLARAEGPPSERGLEAWRAPSAPAAGP